MRYILLVTLFSSLLSCSTKPEEKLVIETFPAKAKAMTIYEVNIRQHTAEGTFTAFQKHLPRLKELGADMLWIMPIQPIGVKNRKGSLGSYYSISDYKSVNPEFGSLSDFKALVDEAHKQGFMVILDWVPNHTSWDHTWQLEYPEFYMTDSAAAIVGKQLGVDEQYYKKSGTGNLVYEADWEDISLLNMHHPGTRKAMIDAMKFWITEMDIDGFRADHAGHEIPLLFWEEATNELNPLKDLFWLAEWDEPRMHKYFHATYEWGLLHLTEDVAKGKATAEDLHTHIANDLEKYGADAFRLNMIDNHDENAWAGTIKERYGDGEKAMAVFSYVAYGVPVLYSGQEAGLSKRLRFFEKDTIHWDDPDNHFQFYQKLNQLKADNPALWNGAYGGLPEKLDDGNNYVFSVKRKNQTNSVIALINMSGIEQVVQLNLADDGIDYSNAFTGENGVQSEMRLSPWEYKVLVVKN